MILLSIIGITAVSVLSDVETKRSRSREKAWKRAAGALGLVFHRGTGAELGSLRGEIAGRRIVLTHNLTESDHQTSLAIQLRDSIPKDLVLHSEGLGSGLATMIGRGDFAIGDRAFDRRFLLEGLGEELSAIFNARARQVLLAEGPLPGPTIKEGWLRLTVGRRIDRRGDLEDWVKHGLSVAAHLDRFDDLPARLIHTARHDPDTPVRLVAFRQLAQNYSDRADVQALATDLRNRYALTHGPVEGRLLALTALGLVGGVDQIEPLHELQQQKGPVGAAAAAAAEQIRSRLGLGGDAGRLSVAAGPTGEEAGRLSRAAAAGSLAITKKG